MTIRIALEIAFSFKRELTDEDWSLEVPAGTDVESAIQRLAERHPALRPRLLDAEDRPRAHIDALINGSNVRFKGGLQTLLQDGDRLTLLPPIGGG
jgi:molybdopterin synthase sulfur carrier subunit